MSELKESEWYKPLFEEIEKRLNREISDGKHDPDYSTNDALKSRQVRAVLLYVIQENKYLHKRIDDLTKALTGDGC